MAVSGVIEAHVRARTQNFDAGMKRVARTLGSLARGMTSGITAVTAAAASMEKSWTAVGVNILAAFAAGGPIAAGLAAVGAGIGMIVGKQKELEEASNAAAAAMRKELDALTKLRDTARERLEATLDLGREPTKADETLRKMIRERAILEEQIRAAKVEFMEAGFARDAMPGVPGNWRTAEMETAKRKVEALEKELVAMDERVTLAFEAAKYEAAAAAAIERSANAAGKVAEVYRGPFGDALKGLLGSAPSHNPLGLAAGGVLGGPTTSASSAPFAFDVKIDALSESLARVESIGESAFMTIGNAIDFAAIRAGNFSSIMENIVEQMANLMLNRALNNLAGSLFGGVGTQSGGTGNTGFRSTPADFTSGDLSIKSAPMVQMTVVTQDAGSFRRSERQVRSAAQRAMGWR